LTLAVVLVGIAGIGVIAIRYGSLAGPASIIPAPPPEASVAYNPAIGSSTSTPTAPVTVTAQRGTLDGVQLTGPDGKPVPGTYSADRTSWTAGGPFAYGRKYTWAGTATGSDHRAVPLAGDFSTVTPAKVIRGTLNIGDNKTVGVAAPIRIQFDGHVTDRAAVEKALSITTSNPVTGSWGWLPDEGGGSRIDYRTKDYWPAQTKVMVAAKLFGVAYGAGAYGSRDISSSFTIGRAQIVRADVNSFHLIVLVDGKQVADYPASYGLATDPERNTRSGIHVVSEKFTDKRMVSQRYDYDNVEKWAVRISNNGEFIHANPVSAAAQGSANVTHGCVNLSLENAEAYYNTALYGDPVEVTGTPIQLSAQDGDLWDWTLSWAQWQGLSALR
jgi:lipoprotein-anchoring transpeptidase ErfK/SrfK